MNASFPPKAEGCFPSPKDLPEVIVGGFKYVDVVPMKRGILFRWGYPNFGFGEVAMWCGPHGQWVADTEGMGPGFCAKMIEHWLRGILGEGGMT